MLESRARPRSPEPFAALVGRFVGLIVVWRVGLATEREPDVALVRVRTQMSLEGTEKKSKIKIKIIKKIKK